MFDILLDGGLISVGDWIKFVRKDRHSDCSNALSNTATDQGGLVLLHGASGKKVGVQLDGEIDGMVDPTPYDGHFNITSYRGEQDTSTYVMCLASASANSKTYSAGNGPTSSSEFVYYDEVKIYLQHHQQQFQY